METVLVKVQLQICMLPNNSQIYCNCHCFYILIWQPVVTSMKCLRLFRYYSIYSKINRFWVKDAIQAPSCSVEVVVWKLGLVWLALVTGREGGGDNKHRHLQTVLARHLVLCYTNYAQNYHRQTNIVWRSVVVAMSHKLYTKTEMGSWAQWCFVLAFKMSTGLSLNFALTQLKQHCHHFEHKLCLYFPHFQKSQQTHCQPSICPLRNDLRRASTISSCLLWSMWSMWSTSKDRFFRFESLSRFP